MSAPAAAAAAPRAARRLAALARFRQCLRSAARCPAFDQRETMRLYARGRFRDARGERDPARVAHLLAEGAAELATMDSYHAAREAKGREAAAAARRREAQEAEGEGEAGGGGGEGRSGGGAGTPAASLQSPSPLPLLSPAAPALHRAAVDHAPPPPLPPPSPPPPLLPELLDHLGAALGALDERALGASARRALQALSLRVDGVAAALGDATGPGAAAAALLEAQAAQRELQRLLLGLRGEDGARVAEEALGPLSLGLRRLQFALRRAAAPTEAVTQ